MIIRRTEEIFPESDAESQKILNRSSVFHELKREKNEINKLKWIESEKSGYDIGYEKALFLWAWVHRSPWRSARTKSQFGKQK